MRGVIIAMLLVAGCEKNLALPDAPALDANPYCAQPTPPLVAGQYILYLNTEGVTLTKGSPSSSANMSDLIAAADVTVPPFLPGDPNRLVFIDQIVRGVQGVLAPYSLDIVTTRPASGDYYMFVLGGDGMTISGCQGCVSTTDFNCMIEPRNGVDLMFDLGTGYGATFYMNVLLGDIGPYADFAATSDLADCGCRIDTGCSADKPLCTFGTMATVTKQTYGSCDRTVQDEPLLLEAAFGCRGAP
jgi:hypothetical protein